MDRSIIPEKLRAPSLPTVFLRRPRLRRLWEERSRRRLLFVTAGAGYGKSSFLADCVVEEPREALWYRADEGDAHPPIFAAHLQRLLGASPPHRAGPTGEPADPRGLLAILVAALRARGPSTLIFDDAHLLAGHDESLRILEGIGGYLPEQATMVIASREPLPFGGTRARAAGQAAVIEAKDLAFDPEEIAALFALRFPGSKLSGAHARRIHAATEGWAAGLEMFLQTIAAPVASAIEHALDRFEAAGAGWFDYLAEEVLCRLDESTREFVIRTSILPECEPATCNRLLGRSDSRRLLEELVRRNLFTLREGADGSTYRYHRLFHQFLRSRLTVGQSSGGLRRLRERATKELLRAGNPAGALELIAEAGDVDSAIRILSRHGTSLLRSGRREPVERGLAIIPKSRLARAPEVRFVRARLEDDLGRWEEAERSYRLVLRRGPAAARRVEVLSRLGQLVSRRGEYAKAMAFCRQGLRERRHGDTQAQGRLLFTLGVAACELGDLEEGERRFEEARALLHRRGDAIGEAQVEYLLAANVYLSRGDFATGREAARRALARLQSEGDPRRICQCLGVLAWLSALAGDVGEARFAATEARRSAQTLRFPQAESMALHVLGRCALIEGDLVQARVLLEETRRLGDKLNETDARILSRLLLGECALRLEDPASARKLGGEALALAREANDQLQIAQACVLLGLAAGVEGAGRPRATPPASRAMQWAQAERIFRRLGALYDLHRLLLLRLSVEMLPMAVRRRVAAELLAGTARVGHDALFLVAESDRAPRVLTTALQDGVAVERVTSLLAGLGSKAVGELLSLSESSDEAVRLGAVSLLAESGGAPARAGLRRLARGEPSSASTQKARSELAHVPAAPLHIFTLGAFRVSVGGTEIPLERWRSGRARRLFQFLLVHRFRWVEGEELLEALWPEADPEKSRANLWQSVFQLRRVLEPSLDRHQVSCYVRVEETRYRLEPGDGHRVDAAEFEEAVRQADRLAAAGRSRAAEGKYRAALELYQGEFLAESRYEEFLLSAREQFRELFVHATQRLTGTCAAARRWGDVVPLCRAVLRDDPYHEEMYGHLVTALLHLGHRREALEAYEQFEARVVGELGLLRSPRMQELAERIRVGRRG